jgi:hypothetical protein
MHARFYKYSTEIKWLQTLTKGIRGQKEIIKLALVEAIQKPFEICSLWMGKQIQCTYLHPIIYKWFAIMWYPTYCNIIVFCGKPPMSKIQSTIAHGKSIIASMILQIFRKCKIIKNNDKRSKRFFLNSKIALTWGNTKTSWKFSHCE